MTDASPPNKLFDRFWRLLGRARRVETTPVKKERGRFDHIIILDGTMSSLFEGEETNAGLIYRLLDELPDSARVILRYEAGVQWQDWGSTRAVIDGRDIHKQIVRAYGDLASRYHAGDRIFLFGYSRGAYAVRALAGLIDRIGLLRGDAATERLIQTAYRHYLGQPDPAILQDFQREYCHPQVMIDMLGVFDTVKALGIRLPLLWTLSDTGVDYHDSHLATCVKVGRHALALNETRMAFEPVLWTTKAGDKQDVAQMWFRGVHGDIGGHVAHLHASRPLANIPLVWMLEEAVEAGLKLPADWRQRFPTDRKAPSVGSFGGWGWLFLLRRRRKTLRDPSEFIHASALVGQDDWL